jgi:hypothetical protein
MDYTVAKVGRLPSCFTYVQPLIENDRGPAGRSQASRTHLHLDLPEIEDRKPALKNEKTFDNVQKAAGRLNIDFATISRL